MIIFDLDGTLAESKQTLDPEMLLLLKSLLQKDTMSVISGCAFIQFQLQILDHINATEEELQNLFFFPTNAAAFYKYNKGAWEKVYEEKLTDEEVEHITKALLVGEAELDIKEEKLYGDKIESRTTQVTYSGIGQKAPIEAKKPWDPDHKKRAEIVKIVAPLLPNFEVRIAGATSIDITRKGRDKAYGIRQIEKYLGVKREDMTFVGDSLFPGGNDFPVIATGIDCVEVKTVDDTKKFVKELLG